MLMPPQAKINTDESVALAMRLLALCYHKCDIKRALAHQFGGDARTHETIISRARKLILAAGNVEAGSERALALETYRAVIASKDARPVDKVKARERILRGERDLYF